MFTPVKNKRLYQHIVEQIQEDIFDGKLKKGDKLPPERDLVTQLNVSRSSIREALRALEVTGLIECRQGEGNFISGDFESTLLKPLTAMFLLNNGTPEDLLDLRLILEVNASRLAAERINDTQKIHLIQIIDQLSDSTLEKTKAEIDVQLHYYIAEITGNPLIINVLAMISSMMERFIQTNRSIILENPNNQRMLFRTHEDIVNAIIAKQPDEAAKAMEKHLQLVRDIVYK